MTKIPLKTLLPREAWAFAAAVTLFSMVCSYIEGPAASDRTQPRVAQALHQQDGPRDTGVFTAALIPNWLIRLGGED
jgi:hypothetical protein